MNNRKPNITRLRGDTYMVVTPFINIMFYKLDQHDIIMFDSGFSFEIEDVIALLRENHLHVKAVVTSHAHYDHIGGHIRLREEFGALIYQSRFDAAVCEDILSMQAVFYTDIPSDIGKVYPYMIFPTDCVISPEADHIEISGVRFDILRIPGHTFQQLGFITPDNVAYLADAMLGERFMPESYLIFFHNWSFSMESIRRISKLKCACYVLAHQDVLIDISDLAVKSLVRFETIGSAMEELACEWMTKEQLAAVFLKKYGVPVKSIVRFNVMNRTCFSIIDYLRETGKLEVRVKDYFLQYIKAGLGTSANKED